MLKLAQEDLSLLVEMKSRLDNILKNAAINIVSDVGETLSGCGGACKGCKGCDGCKGSSEFSCVKNFSVEELKACLDDMDTYGPILFNEEFIAELKSKG
jgi:hypothetical protein